MAILLAQIGVVIVYSVLAVILFWVTRLIYKLLCRKLKPENSFFVAVGIVIIILTSHFIYYGILFTFYAPFSIQKINESLKSPVSIYIQDNVHHSLKNKHKGMIIKYLDGYHLNILAINDNENNVYIYQKTETIVDVEQIVKNVEIYKPNSELPFFNYHVIINELDVEKKLNSYHADYTKIIDMKDKKEVAHSYRYWSFSPVIYRFFLGSDYGVKMGDGPYAFLEKVIFTYPKGFSDDPTPAYGQVTSNLDRVFKTRKLVTTK